MNNSILFRQLDEDDADDFLAFRLSALQNAPEAFGMLYQEELARSRQDTANRLKNRLVVGGYQHDSLVGTVGFNQGETAKTRHKGYIWGLYVSDKHRGLGIGERLITELLARLDPQVVQITLSVVKENRSAISLYQRVGFTCYGEEPRALKNTDGYSDEVLMYRLI